MRVINFQGHLKVISDNPKIKREKTRLTMLKKETIAASARINLNSNYLHACLNHCLTSCSPSEREAVPNLYDSHLGLTKNELLIH